jgi:hypothetical protein
MSIKLIPLPLTDDEIARFWSKVERGAPDVCWPWKAGRFPSGYGAFWLRGKLYRSSRIAFALTRGYDPGASNVLHRCDNSACNNPGCFFEGSDADNMADRDAKGRQGWAKRTHCAYGHEYTLENTAYNRRGHRVCRACRRRNNQRWVASSTYVKPIIRCVECGRDAPHGAHGICHTCYERARRRAAHLGHTHLILPPD